MSTENHRILGKSTSCRLFSQGSHGFSWVFHLVFYVYPRSTPIWSLICRASAPPQKSLSAHHWHQDRNLAENSESQKVTWKGAFLNLQDFFKMIYWKNSKIWRFIYATDINWHVLSMQLTFSHLKKRPGFPQKMLRFPIPCHSCQYTVGGPVGFLGSRRWIALRMVSETCIHGPALNGIKNTHSGQFLTNLTPSCT